LLRSPFRVTRFSLVVPDRHAVGQGQRGPPVRVVVIDAHREAAPRDFAQPVGIVPSVGELRLPDWDFRRFPVQLIPMTIPRSGKEKVSTAGGTFS
jgi:hypothetical protein